MLRTVTFIVLLFCLTGLSGCALLPYHDRPACAKGAGAGYCGRMTDVYKYILREDDRWPYGPTYVKPQ